MHGNNGQHIEQRVDIHGDPTHDQIASEVTRQVLERVSNESKTD